eukprot:5999551-Karenia_brevis.AAC.1
MESASARPFQALLRWQLKWMAHLSTCMQWTLVHQVVQLVMQECAILSRMGSASVRPFQALLRWQLK